jgi:hypothetical protein
MKIEFDIEVGSGSWTPGKAILEMIKEAYEQKHEHSNKTVLDKIAAVESEVKSDSDNPVSSSAVAREIEKIHSHENKDVLDRFGTDDAGDVTFDGKGIAQRKTATETFDFVPENSYEKILLLQDFEMKLSGKEIAMIEVLEGDVWKNLDVISAEDFAHPSARLNKYVVYDESYGCDVLAYYFAFETRPAWYIASYNSVRVTYYI